MLAERSKPSPAAIPSLDTHWINVEIDSDQVQEG
jgi:hypothetical protein